MSQLRNTVTSGGHEIQRNARVAYQLESVSEVGVNILHNFFASIHYEKKFAKLYFGEEGSNLVGGVFFFFF